MLKWLIACAALALVACSESVTDTNTQNPESANSGWSINPGGDLNGFFECLEAEGATLISAHRGGPRRGFPENAIETMAAVLQEIPAIIEIDVATSADGVLYLLHDDTLDRTTTGTGEGNALSWSEIRKLKLKDENGRATGFSPSRFAKTLAWAKHRTILQIDFKRSTRYSDVAREIHRQKAEDRVILIAYSVGSAAKLHRLMPDAMISISLNSQSTLNRAVAAGIPDNRILGFTGTDDPNPRLFSILNGRDVEVIFGTLGGRDSIDETIARSGYGALYAEIAADGADIIATDRPIAAYAALAKAGRAVTNDVCGVTKG
ncbi:MAG: glycerophosphodiester phosphodiesterase family protein [Alphaproteobacteria bacterium]|nr:glycerophosphodiester phosphodiesterase family protein [Alphaproteobacteria bacterium]